MRALRLGSVDLSTLNDEKTSSSAVMTVVIIVTSLMMMMMKKATDARNIVITSMLEYLSLSSAVPFSLSAQMSTKR